MHLLLGKMENNASDSATTSSEDVDIKKNRKRSQNKKADSGQSQKQRRTYSKKSKSSDNKKASSTQLDSNHSFEVENMTTSDDENYEAFINSNEDGTKTRKIKKENSSDDENDAKKSNKRICRDKHDNRQMQLSSFEDKKSTNSSQFDTPVLVKEENNAVNSGVDNSEATTSKDDIKENRKRSQKNQDDSRQSQKTKRNYVKKWKYGDYKKASSPQLDGSNSFKVENMTSDDENYEACMNSNTDTKRTRKIIIRNKDVNIQMKHFSCEDKKFTGSSQFDTAVLVKEEKNESNSDDNNDEASTDSNNDGQKSKKRMSRDNDDNGRMKLSPCDDKKLVLLKEENNESSLGTADVDNYEKTINSDEIYMAKKRARTDNDCREYKQECRTYHSDKRNSRWEQSRYERRRSTPHRRLNQSLLSNTAHSTPVREYGYSLNRSLSMSFTMSPSYAIFEVAPIYNGFQLLGDSQLLRFAEKLLPGPKNIYTPAKFQGSRRWGYCVSGQTTRELARRLIQEECPLGKKVIVLIGTNDMLQRTPPEMLYENYSSLVNYLKAKTETIILLTVPPVPRVAVHPTHWTILQNFNYFIHQFVDNDKVYCLDVASIYISYNNNISMNYYEKTFHQSSRKDYIHLNQLGFEMAQTMINNLLKSKNL